MSTLIEDARDILIAAGVGQAPTSSPVAWDIFAGHTPKEPNEVISINQSGGAAANPRWLLDYPGIQIRIRGPKEDYLTTYSKADAIKDAMIGLPSQTIGTNRWVSVTMPSDIFDLGQDDDKRQEFTINFNLIIEPATGTNRISL